MVKRPEPEYASRRYLMDFRSWLLLRGRACWRIYSVKPERMELLFWKKALPLLVKMWLLMYSIEATLWSVTVLLLDVVLFFDADDVPGLAGTALGVGLRFNMLRSVMVRD